MVQYSTEPWCPPALAGPTVAILTTAPQTERPAPKTRLDELRDRFVNHGATTLSNVELQCLLIRHTDTQAEVTPLARLVLAKADHQLCAPVLPIILVASYGVVREHS